ncbi:MAG: riboflavin synthase [Acidobacteria bacterium]|nr:riboflavin synthase [Acidobacteriota bacterium]
MFTGLIQQTGKIASLDLGGRSGSRKESDGGTARIRVAAEIASQLKEGDSIAVNGVCLTALRPSAHGFEADLAQETIARTSLSKLGLGRVVNLELPMRAGSPLGGHIVQGHVDGIGTLLSLDRVGPASEDRWMLVEIPSELTRYVVEKGSITIDGISLTVARIEGTRISIAVIPHTFQVTNLSTLKPGQPVNIEVDVLARYAEKQAHKERSWNVEELVSRGF